MSEACGREFSGKVAIVTGGAVGLGRNIAMSLAAAGADVALTWVAHERDGREAIEEIEGMGRRAMGCHLDATSTVEVESAVERTLASLGRVDICVNNAGGLMGRVKVADMADAHWEGVLAVNLTTAFRCTRAVLPHLGEGGRIVNISSLSAFNGGGQGYVAYATAKAAICGFTRSLAKEVAPRRITVNAVAPGFVPGTPFHDQFTPPDLQETIIRSIPLGRGTPEDVSSAVMWLCSPGASWVTGATIPVNGGHYFS